MFPLYNERFTFSVLRIIKTYFLYYYMSVPARFESSMNKQTLRNCRFLFFIFKILTARAAGLAVLEIFYGFK